MQKNEHSIELLDISRVIDYTRHGRTTSFLSTYLVSAKGRIQDFDGFGDSRVEDYLRRKAGHYYKVSSMPIQ